MPPTNVYSVSWVTARVKALFSGDALLSDVWITGEVSNFKQASSGHCYFTLKDPNCCLRTVIWRTQAQAINLPREGDAVVAHGYLSVYEPRGDYQFYVDRLEAAGAGWLWQEYQRLKTRLEAAGLFDESRKRPIPALPVRIGVVTSPTGAALRDILRTLARRFPLVDVVLAPAVVQGQEAPASIVAAIDLLNRWSATQAPIDIIIVARGGGSIEELWAFNDEQVAYAIAGSASPVISGVGHETDYTIADFVADVRAATPTAAAVAAVPDIADLRASVWELSARARAEVEARLDEARASTEELSARAGRLSPQRRIDGDRQRIDDLLRRVNLAASHRLSAARAQLAGQRLYLAGIDPRRVLQRGYAIVTGEHGATVASVRQVAPGSKLRVRVADGEFGVQVESQ